MEGKARYIFPAILSGIMAFIMTAFVTLLNLGLQPDFFYQWVRAFVFAWPLAYCAAFIAAPIARKATGNIVQWLENRA